MTSHAPRVRPAPLLVVLLVSWWARFPRCVSIHDRRHSQLMLTRCTGASGTVKLAKKEAKPAAAAAKKTEPKEEKEKKPAAAKAKTTNKSKTSPKPKATATVGSPYSQQCYLC